MRHGFLKDGASRFLLSFTVICAAGLGIGAGGPALLTALSKPAYAQDVVVQPMDTKPSNLANTPYAGLLPSAQVAARPVQQEMPAPAALRIVRSLEEPLVATGPTTAEEDAALSAATTAFAKADAKADFPDQAASLLAFLAKYPNGGWAMAVQTNLGLRYYNAGYYSRAIDAFQQAWQLGRGSEILEVKRLTDRAVGELLRMHARIGHADEIEKLLADMGDRPINGQATELVAAAREGAWVMRHEPDIAFTCGPNALANVLETLGASRDQVMQARMAKSGPHGVNLTELADLATKTGLSYTLVKREAGQPVPVPSVINWKLHHYAAVVAEKDGGFVLKDPTFDSGQRVVTRAALDAEGSGYYLVPAGASKSAAALNAAGDWRTVDAASDEAKAVYGMGYQTTNNGKNGICAGISNGMCASSLNVETVSATINDTPVGYAASKGPGVNVTFTYNQREATQPANFTYFNVGQKWNMNWLSFIVDDPVYVGYNIERDLGGGGAITEVALTRPVPFMPEVPTGATLVRNPWSSAPLVNYTLSFPDGSKHIFALPDGATSAPRKVFLTKVIDPQGNETNLAYDASFRLTTITDAAGKVTTFSYGLAGYPLLITQVTDPFGRSTTLTYDASQRLASITDAVGIVSSFHYDASGIVDQLNTPYGQTTYAYGTISDPYNLYAFWQTVTDPLGYLEKAEHSNNQNAADIPISDPAAKFPTGDPKFTNNYFYYRNTFHWDKHVAVTTTTDHQKATQYHWSHDNNNGTQSSFDLENLKKPLENRVEFLYTNGYNSMWSGLTTKPSTVARVLDDGSTVAEKATYDTTATHFPQLLTKTDALGRTTRFTYDATSAADLLKIEQQISATPTWATLATTTYNTQHEPLTVTDAAGQLWQYAYNAAGQMIYATDPLNETRFWEYDASGRITRVTTPVAVAFASVVYGTTNVSAPTAKSYNYSSPCSGVTAPANTNLPISVTDSEGYVLCYQYDGLNRVTAVKYPDGTTDQYDYSFPAGWITNGVNYGGTQSLDVWKVTDRLGRVTNYSYDRNRQLINRSETVTVAGVATTRTTGYSYYENGVLKELTDANGAVTHWNIDLQSRPTSKTYAYGTANAKTETYVYENTTSRLKSITDARGQTVTFTYNKDNTLASYAYTGAIVATAGASFTYDPWYQRRTGMTDQYGTTSWTYRAIGSNGALKLDTEDGPFSNDTIAYGYDALGRVNSRTVPGGSAETVGYDLLGRMNSHVNDLGSFTYAYLGNSSQAASRTIGGIVTSWGYDTNTNDRRLLTIGTTGAVARSFSYTSNPYQVTGITDTPAATHPWLGQTWSYTYDASDRLLTGNGSIAGGSSFSYDRLNNATSFAGLTGTYDNRNLLSTFNGTSYSYDANGNLTSDGTRTYTYDAADRLLTVTQGAVVTSFGYDGLGRRVKQTYVNGTTTNTRYLWCGAAVCQIRDGIDTVTTKLFAEGEYRISGTKKYLYLIDRLGSVRDVVDITGTPTLVGSFDYAPYGAVARSWGTVTPAYQYAQLLADVGSGLYLSLTRAYSPANGKWLNVDPARESGGINLTGYGEANPVANVDASGLDPIADRYALGFEKAAVGAIVVITVVALLPAAVVAAPAFLVAGAVLGGLGAGAWAGALTNAIRHGCVGDIAELIGAGVGAGIGGAALGTRFPKTIGDYFEGVDPDTMLHLTPFPPGDFAGGVDAGTFWARLGDVAHLTPGEYRDLVVGIAAAGGTPGANNFVFVLPGSGGGFARVGISWGGYPEFGNTSPVPPSGFVRVPKG